MTQGCVMTLTQGNKFNVKVTAHTYPKSVSRPSLLPAMLNLDIISHNCCPWPNGVSIPWAKVISPRSRSQCTYTEKPCPGPNSSLPCLMLIIYHTIVSWPWLRVISPRSRSQFTNGNFFSRPLHVPCTGNLDWDINYFTQLLSMTQGLLLRGGICPVMTFLVCIALCDGCEFSYIQDS